MLGPLPLLHRLIIIVAVTLAFLALGAVLGAMDQVPVVLGPGLALGALVGALAAYLTVHQPRRH